MRTLLAATLAALLCQGVTLAKTPTTIMSLVGGLNGGDRVTVGQKQILCFDTTDAVGSFAQAVGVGDTAGERDVASQHAVVASGGAQLLVIDSSMSPPGVGALRFRITRGANTGMACWLPGSTPMTLFAHVTPAR